MRIVFRADAGLEIGTGHVMRCLTLAAELARRGHDCAFASRALPGNLNARIAGEFPLTVLPAPAGPAPPPPPAHAAWAGVDWADDAAETRAAAEGADWLIVDHYAFDGRWQAAARPPGARVMVIDDLADRPHDCALLLDQNLGHEGAEYDALVPASAARLIGPIYALLRPEFAAARAAALAGRVARGHRLRHLLVAPGGIDAGHATGRVLDALAAWPGAAALRVTVALGPTAPHLDRLRAMDLPFACDIRANSADMAALIAGADLAIGAAGVSMLERCCLGLPTLLLVLARNQVRATEVFTDRGAALSLGLPEAPELPDRLVAALTRLSDPAALGAVVQAVSGICDGGGTVRVADALVAEG